MTRTIAIANQKGGVGKTTTAVNLAAALSMRNTEKAGTNELGLVVSEKIPETRNQKPVTDVLAHQILLVDIDPQAHTTVGLGFNKQEIKLSVYDVLLNRTKIKEAIRYSIFPNLDLLPSSISLAGAELELADLPGREIRLKSALEIVQGEYSFIFIDCPPSLGLLTLQGLVAAQGVIVPVQGEYYSLEGIAQLMETINLVKKSLNPELRIDGILLTMFNPRLNLARQVREDVKNYFGGRVFNSVIPRSVRLAEAPSFGKTIFQYDITSPGAQAYLSLAAEVLNLYEPPAQENEVSPQSGDNIRKAAVADLGSPAKAKAKQASALPSSLTPQVPTEPSP